MSLKDAIREAAVERNKQENPAQEIAPEPEPIAPIEEKAVNTANNKAVKPASSKTIKTARKTAPAPIPEEEEEIETAAMTVRVPRAHRIHWLISAKKEGTSLTAAITEALNNRFGEPEE